MSRRYCPVCKKEVEIKVIRNENKITKVCPECGYVFISYEVKRSQFVT